MLALSAALLANRRRATCAGASTQRWTSSLLLPPVTLFVSHRINVRVGASWSNGLREHHDISSCRNIITENQKGRVVVQYYTVSTSHRVVRLPLVSRGLSVEHRRNGNDEYQISETIIAPVSLEMPKQLRRGGASAAAEHSNSVGTLIGGPREYCHCLRWLHT
jgi:hypothetical protein